MRPESIRRFDLFYLGSIALLVLGFVMSFDSTVASMQAQTAAKGLQVGAGFTVGIFAVVLAIDLVLWFLISRKGIAIAKWLLVLLAIVDLVGLPALFSGALTTPKVISLARIALEAIAIVFLFKADAKAWFAGSTHSETEDPGPSSER